MPPFTITPTAEADVPLLLDLIRELVEFERLAHEIEVTADSLREALFGADAVARAILARHRCFSDERMDVAADQRKASS
jgi:hypothetical protein